MGSTCAEGCMPWRRWSRLTSRKLMNNHRRNPLKLGSLPEQMRSDPTRPIAVSLLTGGGDKPYAFGLATELIRRRIVLDLIGSDDLDCPDFRDKPRVHFLNLRGDQRTEVSFAKKILRVFVYYIKLIGYALTAKSSLFHLLWNNKFQSFDR